MSKKETATGYGNLRDFFRAVDSKDYRLITKLLSQTDPAQVVDQAGATLLMYSIFNTFVEGGGDIQMVKFLIDRGVPVNAADKKQRWTALHYAASLKRADIVKTLIDSGAEVDARDKFGNTALARSLNPGPLDDETIAVLIAAGSDPNASNVAGKSPLDFARMTKNEGLERKLKHG